MNNLNKIEENLTKRKHSRKISYVQPSSKDTLILTHDCDQGVIRNGGRLGARFAAKCILNKFLKQINVNNTTYSIVPVYSNNEDFDQKQNQSIDQISEYLKTSYCHIIQIGGGHDHIYPLLKSLEKHPSKGVIVINIDAHCDTRTDSINHSGTPFRQFANETKKDFKLVQVGTQDASNPDENFKLSPNSSRVKQYIISHSDVIHYQLNGKVEYLLRQLDQIITTNNNHLVVLSLDVDAIQAAHMNATSAPNGMGLPPELIFTLIRWYKNLPLEQKVLGIYEYNPIYDNINGMGALCIAQLMHEFVSKP